ncbi:MAG: hypothetical protein ACYCRE_11995 [Acidobacteriaceae bacterium]
MVRWNKLTKAFAETSVLLAAIAVSAQSSPHSYIGSPEQRTAQAFLAAVQSGPLDLHAFLERMPKGADLHNHLSGAVYAETWIAEAASDRLCVNLSTYTLAEPTGLTRSLPPQPVCGAGNAAAEETLRNPELYSEMIDAYPMRDFVAREGDSGHDHFFNSFGKFDVVNPSHEGEWLDQVAREAASENTQYLELMVTPDFGHGGKLGAQLGWNSNLEQFRRTLLAHGLREGVPEARQTLAHAEEQRKTAEHCGQPDAEPAC